MRGAASFEEKKRLGYSEACAFLHGTTKTPVLYEKGPGSELGIVMCLTGSKGISERLKSDGRMLVDWQFVLAHVLGIVGMPHMIPEMFRYQMQYYHVQYLGVDPNRTAYKNFFKWAAKDPCFALRDIFENVIERYYNERLSENKRPVFVFLTDLLHTSRRAAHAFYLAASCNATGDDPKTFLDALQEVAGFLEDLVTILIGDSVDVMEGRDFEPLKELEQISQDFKDDWTPSEFSSTRQVYQTCAGCKFRTTFCKAAHYSDTCRHHSGPDFVGPYSAMYVLTAKLAFENPIAFPGEIFLSAFQDMRKTDRTDYKNQDDEGKLDWETLQDKFDEKLFKDLSNQHVARMKEIRRELSGYAKKTKAILDDETFGDIDSEQVIALFEKFKATGIYNVVSQDALPKNLQPSFCGEALIPDFKLKAEKNQGAASKARKSSKKSSSGGNQGTARNRGKSSKKSPVSLKKSLKFDSPRTPLGRSERAKRRATVTSAASTAASPSNSSPLGFAGSSPEFDLSGTELSPAKSPKSPDAPNSTARLLENEESGFDCEDDGPMLVMGDDPSSPSNNSPAATETHQVASTREQEIVHEIPDDSIYYEQQTLFTRECGMCAINNLLQRAAVVKDLMDENADKVQAVQDICAPGLDWLHKEHNGNWSIDTMQRVSSELFKKDLNYLRERNIAATQGVIVNYKLEMGAHYMAVVKRGEDFWALDSLHPKNCGILSGENLAEIEQTSRTCTSVHVLALYEEDGTLADLSKVLADTKKGFQDRLWSKADLNKRSRRPLDVITRMRNSIRNSNDNMQAPKPNDMESSRATDMTSLSPRTLEPAFMGAETSEEGGSTVNEQDVLASQQMEVAAKNGQIAELKKALARKDTTIRSLERAMQKKVFSESVELHKIKITWYENKLERLKEENQEASNRLARLKATISDRDDTISDRDDTIVKLLNYSVDTEIATRSGRLTLRRTQSWSEPKHWRRNATRQERASPPFCSMVFVDTSAQSPHPVGPLHRAHCKGFNSSLRLSEVADEGGFVSLQQVLIILSTILFTAMVVAFSFYYWLLL